MIKEFEAVLENNIDELLALIITLAYIGLWMVHNPMPNDLLLLVFGYYFGKKV